jgi:hypothetical protein
MHPGLASRAERTPWPGTVKHHPKPIRAHSSGRRNGLGESARIADSTEGLGMPAQLTAEQRRLALRLKARGPSLPEIGPQVGCSQQGSR